MHTLCSSGSSYTMNLNYPPFHPRSSHTFFSPSTDWSTLAQEKVLLSWTLISHLACARALSKAWRPMCSGWTLPRSCPPGLICWWRVAIMLLSSSRRSPRVWIQRFVWLPVRSSIFLHLGVEKNNFVLNDATKVQDLTPTLCKNECCHGTASFFW